MQSGQIDEMRLRKLWYSVVAQIQTANILYKIFLLEQEEHKRINIYRTPDIYENTTLWLLIQKWESNNDSCQNTK